MAGSIVVINGCPDVLPRLDPEVLRVLYMLMDDANLWLWEIERDNNNNIGV